MDEISTQLRAVVAEAPPTRIDVDGLIRADRRRRRQRTWLLTGTGVAGAVAAILVVPALAAGPVPTPTTVGLPPAGAPQASASLCAGVTPKATGPQPDLQSHGTVRTRPTEAPADGVARLTVAVRDALRTRLPAGTRIDPAQKGCAEPQFQYHPSYREYTMDATLRRGAGSGFLMLQVGPTARDTTPPDCKQAFNSRDCRVVSYSDGSTALVSKSEEAPGARQLWVTVFRPDGTSVLAITHNYRTEVVGNKPRITPTADAPLLAMDQLVDLARSPGLTLYP